MVGLALWDLSHNAPLLTALLCAALAQLLKVGAHWQATREWEWGRLAGSGGMPSSHAALVHGLASAIAAPSAALLSDLTARRGISGKTGAGGPFAEEGAPVPVAVHPASGAKRRSATKRARPSRTARDRWSPTTTRRNNISSAETPSSK